MQAAVLCCETATESKITSVDDVQLAAWKDVQPSLKEFGVKGNVKRSILSIHSTVRQQGNVLHAKKRQQQQKKI